MLQPVSTSVEIRWHENADLRRDAISSQTIDALESQGDKGDRQWRRLALQRQSPAHCNRDFSPTMRSLGCTILQSSSKATQ
jgi:hypothetical protein